MFSVLSNPMWLLATTQDSEDLLFVMRLKAGEGLLTHQSLRSHIGQRLEANVGSE